jgi:hypothetical protein
MQHPWDVRATEIAGERDGLAWDVRAARAILGAPDEDQDDGDPDWPEGDYSEAESDNAPPSRESLEQQACDYLIALKREGVLSAKQLCSAMFYFELSGISTCKKYALPPSLPKSQSGHYQRKLDSASNSHLEREKLYPVEVPGHAKHSHKRIVHTVQTLPVQDQGLAAHVEDPRTIARFVELKSKGVPPVFSSHALIQGPADLPDRGDPLPFVIFIDGLPYSIADSVIGFWFVCLSTGKRFLVGILRNKWYVDVGAGVGVLYMQCSI